MAEKQSLPVFSSYEEVSEFWDTHSLADFWDETEEVEFQIAPDARRRYLVAIDPTILQRVQRLARGRGLSTESLVNLFLEQHLHELGVPSS